MMNVDKNGNRGKVCKVEVPIGFLKMHLKVSHSLGRKFKDFNGIILNCGGSGGDSKDQEFCLKEQVKDNSDCVGIIIKPEEGLREDIAATFSDNPDIVAVYVYCKVDKSVVVDGVIKVISPKVVFGNKERCAGFLSCKAGSSGKVGRKDGKSHQKALDWVKEIY